MPSASPARRWPERRKRRPGTAFSTCLFLNELQDLLEEFEALLLKYHEMRRIRNQDVFLDGSMDQIAHQAFAVFRIGPCVEVAADHERRRVDVGGIPQRASGCLIEGVLEHAVGR